MTLAKQFSFVLFFFLILDFIFCNLDYICYIDLGFMQILANFQSCFDFFGAFEFLGLFCQILDVYCLVSNLISFLHVSHSNQHYSSFSYLE